MYYVMQVSPHEERRVIEWLKAQLDASLYTECFHLTRLMKRKIRGSWREYTQTILPGYVFVETDYISDVRAALKKIPLMTKFLGRGGEAYSPLNDMEEAWLTRLKGFNGEVALSFVRIMDDGEIKILSGPLIGMAGQIKKINLHKRIAIVETELMGVTTTLHLGIEIVKPVVSED